MHPNPRKFALYGGLLMLLIGVLSLLPGWVGSTETLPFLKLENSYGLFLGLLPMNIVNKVVLIAFGVWGISVSRLKNADLRPSIRFCKSVFVLMGIGAILGLIPTTNTLGGYWPLFGGEIWAHGIFAIVGAIYGFTNHTMAIIDRRRDEAA